MAKNFLLRFLYFQRGLVCLSGAPNVVWTDFKTALFDLFVVGNYNVVEHLFHKTTHTHICRVSDTLHSDTIMRKHKPELQIHVKRD